MRILFIADIVAKCGIKTTAKVLPRLKETASIDFVLANAENTANGRGTSKSILEELSSLGIDYFTSGNHIWWQRGIVEELEHNNLPIIRPANYSNPVPGNGSAVLDVGDDRKVLLINLLGRTLINQPIDCPFKTVDAVLAQYDREKLSAVVVDFHAEVTSEKAALGWYLDGRVSAVVGTHTHVPTANGRILPEGTAYITDVGMVGALNSSLGIEPELSIRAAKYPFPVRFDWVDEGPAVFNSVLIDIDEKTGLARSIERIDQTIDAEDII